MDGQKLEKVVKDNFGHADVLVNNSGQYAGRGNIEELDVKAWWSDFVRPFSSLPVLNINVREQELNVKGTYLTTQSFLRLLPKTSKASVITVGSMTADLISPGKSSYVLTKLALNGFNEFVTLENPNVRTVVFRPGAVLTPTLDDFPEARPFALDTRKRFSFSC
jgi:NAD(P)-dependent dehydrogenase (short-subunit alcohol dehydrogenase family)